MTEVQATVQIEQTVPFFWVRDIQRSRAFFEKTLGFTLKRQWVDGGRLQWCWLARDGAAVMLQEIAGEAARSGITASSAPSVAIYFICNDALAFYRELRSRGVEVRRPTVGNGMWVVEIDDPDGRRLFFESATVTPEGTEYRE